MNFFAELKRRNVIKVAVAYIIVGWLTMQAGEVMAPALRLPDWVNPTLAFFLILGFPVAMIFAWAFEMTPEGLKLEKDITRTESITQVTGRKLDFTIIGLLVVGMAYFVIDKFVLDPGRDAAEIKAAVQTAQEQAPGEDLAADKSIAVLPFINMSSDQEQEYFSDGLSEELLNLLAKIPELRVAARTSSFSFKGQNLEIPEIAKRLGVAHVLEGSVRKSGNQLRITAQLIQADNGFHLWSETYDRNLDNIFQIQDEIAENVVDALRITLLGEAPRVRETDPQAYQLFLEGHFHANQVNPESLPKAIELFEQALEIDPDYAPAWGELAFAYLWAGGIGIISIDESNVLAANAVEKALSIDPDYGYAHFVLGSINVFQKFNFEAGIENYQRALELDPGNAFLIGANGTGMRVIGRLDESEKLYLAALELDPVMPEINAFLGLTYLKSRRWDEAETFLRKTLTVSPSFSGGRFRLGRALMHQGELAAALVEMNMEATDVYDATGRAMIHHALGNSEESQLALDELIRDNAQNAAYQVAEVYGFRGEADKAFEWLEQSYVIHDSGLSSILSDPAFDSLLIDPRWQPFLEKLGLLEAWQAMPPEWGGPQP